MYHFTISNNVTEQLSKTCQSQFLTLIWCLAIVLDSILRVKMTLVWQFQLWKAHKTQLSSVCPPQLWSSSFFFLAFHLFAVYYCLFCLCCFPIPCQLLSLLYLCAVDYIDACGLFKDFISPDSDVIVLIIHNFVTNFKHTACWTADNLVLSVKSLWSVFDRFVEELYFLVCFYELLLWPFVSCVLFGGCL